MTGTQTPASLPRPPDASRDGPPVDGALVELERRRRDRGLVVALLVVAVLAALALLVVDRPAAPTGLAAVLGFLVLTVLYGAWVVVEERRSRRVLRALLRERDRVVALDARVHALESLEATVRAVAASDELTEVFSRLLAGALELTGAGSGAVLLDAAGDLTVAASHGPDAPQRGTRLDAASPGPAIEAVRRGETLLSGRGAPWGTEESSHSSIAAPLKIPGRTVGVLVVVRDASAPAFSATEVAVATLFAAHAALGLRNAWRTEADRESASVSRQEVERLRSDAGARADAIAGVVHDLRAPVTAASGFVQLLEQRGDALSPERRRAVLSDVSLAVGRLQGLVDDLLAVATSEAGVAPPLQTVDLAELVRETARLGRGLLLAHADSGPLTVDAPGPALVDADATALARVVVNLIDNAVAHTPAGTAVEVSVHRGDGEVVLRVRDHGPPVDAALLAAAFDPFVAGPGGGVGLGLHVVRSVVERLSGVVTLAAAEDGGTLAEVRLPAGGTS